MIDYQTLVDALTAWQAGATPPPPSDSATRMQAAEAAEPYGATEGQPEEVEMMDSGLVEYEEVEQAEVAEESPAEETYAAAEDPQAYDEAPAAEETYEADAPEGEEVAYEEAEVEVDDEEPT